MPVASSVQTGAYTPSETTTTLATTRRVGTPRGVFWLHGSTASGFQVLQPEERTLWQRVIEAGNGRYVLIGPDAGGGAAYGNDDAMTALSAAVTWAQSAGVCTSGKVALVGHSMGLMTAVNWAYRNATSIAGMCLIDGACYPSDWYDNGIPAYQTAAEVKAYLDGAYPGTWATSKSTRCPKLLADGSSTLRAMKFLHYTAGDGSAGDGIKVIPDASSAAFGTSWGANCTTIKPNLYSTHGSVHLWVPPEDVIAFFDGLVWA